jgi:two-component system sensor histidine kinase DegS
LPAVKKLASNASGANGLIVEVQSFGLENRLENSLEISIFRIIQELVTNIIKHANATTGTVHLTNHNYILNIMVEDNGIGFNPKQITKTKAGMGISSIDKRVEHLDGTLTIESENNKGTTVIIDIPL